MPTIRFEVSRQGKVTIQAQGYQGPICKEKVHGFLTGASLGPVTQEEHTAEYYEQEQIQNLEIENG